MFVTSVALAASAAAQDASSTTDSGVLRWDFENGQTGGWSGHNSQARISDERGQGGRLEGGKWVECKIDLTPYPRTRSVIVQVWDVKQLYVDDISAEIGAPYNRSRP